MSLREYFPRNIGGIMLRERFVDWLAFERRTRKALTGPRRLKVVPLAELLHWNYPRRRKREHTR